MNDKCKFIESEEETSEHILKKCGTLIRKRRDNLGSYYLGEVEVSSFNPLNTLKFIKKAGLQWKLSCNFEIIMK